MLEGEPRPQRDILLVNAPAALVAAGRARDFRDGVALAAGRLIRGAAMRKAEELARFTQNGSRRIELIVTTSSAAELRAMGGCAKLVSL